MSLLSELCVESLREVATALQKEHDLPYSPLLDIHTVLRKDTLAVDDHSTHAKGRFLDFLEQNSIPTKEVSATFRSLLHELQKRSNCESVFSVSDDLKSRKGFSHADFSALLEQVRKASETDQWATISQQLTVDGLDIPSIRTWQRAWSTYRVERLDYSIEGDLGEGSDEIVKICGDVASKFTIYLAAAESHFIFSEELEDERLAGDVLRRILAAEDKIDSTLLQRVIRRSDPCRSSAILNRTGMGNFVEERSGHFIADNYSQSIC